MLNSRGKEMSPVLFAHISTPRLSSYLVIIIAAFAFLDHVAVVDENISDMTK
jgi:hypothetical protein